MGTVLFDLTWYCFSISWLSPSLFWSVQTSPLSLCSSCIYNMLLTVLFTIVHSQKHFQNTALKIIWRCASTMIFLNMLCPVLFSKSLKSSTIFNSIWYTHKILPFSIFNEVYSFHVNKILTILTNNHFFKRGDIPFILVNNK